MTMKTNRRKKSDAEVTHGSGNVFADLGLENPEDELLRAELLWHLRQEIGGRGLTQAEAAALLGVDQPGISRIMSGRFERFSIGRLLRFLIAAGRDVQIVLPASKKAKRKTGRVFIRAA